MKFFYDCEFIEDGQTIDLISIGMVTELGKTFYAINSSCNLRKADNWVKENVIIHLPDKDNILWMPKEIIKIKLKNFVNSHKDKNGIEFYGYYSAYDHVVLCQLFGRMIDLPKGWPMHTNDIKQMCDFLGNPKLPEQSSKEHNALNDAIWNRDAYNFLINYKCVR